MEEKRTGDLYGERGRHVKMKKTFSKIEKAVGVEMALKLES